MGDTRTSVKFESHRKPKFRKFVTRRLDGSIKIPWLLWEVYITYWRETYCLCKITTTNTRPVSRGPLPLSGPRVLSSGSQIRSVNNWSGFWNKPNKVIFPVYTNLFMSTRIGSYLLWSHWEINFYRYLPLETEVSTELQLWTHNE